MEGSARGASASGGGLALSGAAGAAVAVESPFAESPPGPPFALPLRPKETPSARAVVADSAAAAPRASPRWAARKQNSLALAIRRNPFGSPRIIPGAPPKQARGNEPRCGNCSVWEGNFDGSVDFEDELPQLAGARLRLRACGLPQSLA